MRRPIIRLPKSIWNDDQFFFFMVNLLRMYDCSYGLYLSRGIDLNSYFQRDLSKFENYHLFLAVCSEYNHVRTWSVTRFRGMISTQPGPTSISSFNVVALEQNNTHASYASGNKIGKGILIFHFKIFCLQIHSMVLSKASRFLPTYFLKLTIT